MFKFRVNVSSNSSKIYELIWVLLNFEFWVLVHNPEADHSIQIGIDHN